MKKTDLHSAAIVLLLMLMGAFAASTPARAQAVAVKTNALYWAILTPNAAVELALADRWTVDLSAAYNPWTFKDDKKMRFWLAQPEVRYWFCEKFEGHRVGLHLHGGQYYGGFGERRYDGYLAGAGVSYGYAWILSPHWNVDVTVGVGFAHLWYKESPRIPCIKCVEDKQANYVGLTKLGVSFSYLF